jgi:hypothetical protein
MATLIETRGEREIQIHLKATGHFFRNLFVLLFCLGISYLIHLNSLTKYSFFSGISPIFLVFFSVSITIYSAFSYRDLRYVFNLDQKSVMFFRGGIWNSAIDQSKERFDLTFLTAIEMVQHTGRGRDFFSLRLKFGDSQYLRLLDGFNFQQCQDYANQIQKFVGTHIPVTAVSHYSFL